MKPMNKHQDQPNRQLIMQQAAEWYACLLDESVTAHEHQAWQQWLDQDIRHREAWQQIERISQPLKQLQLYNHQQKQAIVQSLNLPSSFNRRQVLGLGMTGLLAGSIIYSQQQAIRQTVINWQADIYTKIGERKNLVWQTGVDYWLNTQTAIQQNEQSIKLLNGEIFFKITKPLQQSIQITSPVLSISTTFAQFALRMTQTHSSVAVVQGTLHLTSSSNQQLFLSAGQQVKVSSVGFSSISTLKTFQYSWIHGVLAAESMTVGQWMTEMMRYHHVQLSGDLQVTDKKVTGLFPLDHLDMALLMLQRIFSLRIHQRFGYWYHLSCI